MTFEEFKTGLTEIVEHSDEKLAELPDFIKEVESDYSAASQLVEKIGNLEDRVRSLQDTNMKLYLAQTGSPADDGDEGDDEDLTGSDAITAFWDKLDKKSNDKED